MFPYEVSNFATIWDSEAGAELTMMLNNHAADSNVRWDLTSLYSAISDPQIDLDIAEFTKQARQFNLNYKGKLADKLGAAISDYSELEMLGGKIMVYLSLQQSLDVTNEAVKAKVAEAQQRHEPSSGRVSDVLRTGIGGAGRCDA